MLAKQLDEIVYTITHYPIAINQFGVCIVDHSTLRLEGKKYRPATEERLIIRSIPLREARHDLRKELALATSPLEERADKRIRVLGHLITCA